MPRACRFHGASAPKHIHGELRGGKPLATNLYKALLPVMPLPPLGYPLRQVSGPVIFHGARFGAGHFLRPARGARAGR
jgi:hypothetical protein